MKLKYFLRGLGTGIIFGALIMLVAYMTSGGYKITDDEIIKRAEKLGMVKEDIADTAEDDNPSEQVSEDRAPKPDADEASEDEPVTDEPATDEPTIDEASTHDDNADSGDDYVTATITVTGGMGSSDVARLLQEAGIIEDYTDFDAYLNANGYSTQIRVKTTEFNSNMTYEDIAKALTSGEDDV